MGSESGDGVDVHGIRVGCLEELELLRARDFFFSFFHAFQFISRRLQCVYNL